MPTDKNSIEWYNQNAHAYAKHVRDVNESVYHSLYEKPAIYKLLPNLKDARVLSLGCGSGEDSHELKKRGAKESIGVDISEGLVAVAQESHKDCQFQVMDMENLEFENNSFDFAYSSLAIHYIEDWTKAFSEAYRVLKPGGYFLFSCNHPVYSAMKIVEDSESINFRLLAQRNDKKADTTEITGSYMDRQIIDPTLNFPLITWHKAIGEVAGEATAAGFLIAEFVEPMPLPELKEQKPKHYELLSKIPAFMIFKLLKPSAR